MLKDVNARKVTKQDVARIICHILFTPSESIAWAKDVIGTKEVKDNEFGYSEFKAELLAKLHIFGNKEDGSLQVTFKEGSHDGQLINDLMTFAFTDSTFDNSPHYYEALSVVALKSLCEVITNGCGGEIEKIDKDCVYIKPNERLPCTYFNVWAPFFDTLWSDSIDASTYYYNHPTAIQNRILLRHSVESLVENGTTTYLPAAHKHFTSLSGRAMPMVATHSGLINVGQFSAIDRDGYLNFIEENEWIYDIEEDEGFGSSGKRLHNYFGRSDWSITPGDEAAEAVGKKLTE